MNSLCISLFLIKGANHEFLDLSSSMVRKHLILFLDTTGACLQISKCYKSNIFIDCLSLFTKGNRCILPIGKLLQNFLLLDLSTSICGEIFFKVWLEGLPNLLCQISSLTTTLKY